MSGGSASQEFGRALKTIRRIRGWTGDEAAKRAEISRAYLIQIEAGMRDNPSDDVVARLHRGYGIEPDRMADLLLRWRVMAALEERGMTDEHRAFVWAGMASRVHELKLDIQTDPNEIVAAIIRSSPLNGGFPR